LEIDWVNLSLKQKNFEEDFKSSKIISRYANSLIAFPRRLLITILVGNTIANVAASIVSVALALSVAHQFQIEVNIILTIQIILTTIIVLIFSELLPKVFASKHPNLSVKIVAIPLYFISTLIYPISELITEMIKLTFSRLKFDKKKSAITENVEEEEQEIITSFVEFKSVLVGEVMTPRVDVVAVPFNISKDELIQTINSSGYSRFPVYKENLDKIIGIVHAKDLLQYLKNKSFSPSESLTKITRDVLFVPETKKISEMLKEFQQNKIHSAIVVDEFGGTSGLITLEDIIEEIIGEIWDEHDTEEDAVKILSSDKISVLGKVPVTEVNELIGQILIPISDDYETVAGLVISKSGDIPKEGYSFKLNGYKLTVKEVLKKRIKRVEIDKIE